ncbi:MAG: pyridoxamine 5-phosphate oxidase [Bacteroidota bacterium]|jgi:pyridoxamine 5'-phosphate oxidase
MKDLGSVRKDYSTHLLLESDVHEDPFVQLERWMEDARKVDPDNYNAMTLSTVDEHGFPNTRIVLLRDLSRKGITFYTNYRSIKAKEIAHNAKIGINFFWPELERQVRLRGEARFLDAAESDAYFASRPRESQIGAWVSEQSTIISNRQVLEDRFAEVESRFKDQPVPRPPHWGGYTMYPIYFEFWQGRPGRLHDRLSYRVDADAQWYIERLAP